MVSLLGFFACQNAFAENTACTNEATETAFSAVREMHTQNPNWFESYISEGDYFRTTAGDPSPQDYFFDVEVELTTYFTLKVTVDSDATCKVISVAQI